MATVKFYSTTTTFLSLNATAFALWKSASVPLFALIFSSSVQTFFDGNNFKVNVLNHEAIFENSHAF